MEVNEAITRINWLDLVIIVSILAAIYRGSRTNFIVELFKVTGVFISIVVSLHFFVRVSDFLLEKYPVLGTPMSDFICLLVLAALVYLVMVLVREAFCRLLKVEAANTLDKVGGFILGFVRGLMLASLILLLFNIPVSEYLHKSVRKSYFSSQLIQLNAKLYEWTFKGLISKFIPDEPFNNSVSEIIELKSEDYR